MNIAILGATSEIAKDLILSFSDNENHELTLYARRPQVVLEWLTSVGLGNKFLVKPLDEFGETQNFDALLNFVGVGNPAKAVAMGPSILDITYKYDEMAIRYLKEHVNCRYIFLSSGAAYGSSFDKPVNQETPSIIPINNLQEQDWYGVAKLYAECRHRALSEFAIVDIRIFNYFSHTQGMEASFLMADILRAIQCGERLMTSAENIVRDYIGPSDFYRLVSLILKSPATNDVVDCYTKAPVDKITLLTSMKERFSLRFEIGDAPSQYYGIGLKKNYFSNNQRAEKFGYSPLKNALQTVMDEAYLVLDHKN
jgi:nucleoside-diphosphate-sugar epimerase